MAVHVSVNYNSKMIDNQMIHMIYPTFSNNIPIGGHQQRLGAEDHGPAGEGGRAHSQTQSEERAEAGVREREPSSVAIRTDTDRA